MLSLRGARAGGMLGTGARVGAVVTLGVLLASVVIDGARPTPQWLCDKVMEAIAMDDTMDADEFECKGSGMPAGHLLEVYEGEFKGADYSTCESFFFGFESLPMLLPAENMWSRSARGGLYLFCLLYVFLGVAIVADVFMNAIETVTSATKMVTKTRADGTVEEEEQKVWNDTIANLSLMALGSSAPEILLSVIGVVTALGEEADALGPGTIVGSAAFNLLFITAVTVMAPAPRIAKVHQYNVYLTTSFFAVEAYMWLLFIVDFHTPERIDLWEAVVTLLHFPLLLCLAYGADRNWNFSGEDNKVQPQLSMMESTVNRMDNNYIAFRRNAVRYLSAAPRVMWKNRSGKTTLSTDPKSPKKGMETSGTTSDPYAELKVGKVSAKTAWVRKNLNPEWDETFTFETAADILLVIWDHDDLSRDDYMGECILELSRLTPGTPLDTWLPLRSTQKGFPKAQGEVHIKVTLSSTSELEVKVLAARNLVGLDKSNAVIDSVAGKLGGGLRSVRSKFKHHGDIWSDMKVDWYYQFHAALYPAGEKDEEGNDMEPGTVEMVMHFFTFFWKVLFATIPPVNYYGGWLTFNVAIFAIGIVTAIVGEIASLFGCVVGLKTAVTAITFVALGTSLPDTFASKAAAEQEEHADAAIGNVTGSNAVNVFLGIGLPWTIATIYAEANGESFTARSCGFGLNCFVYGILALSTLALLGYRRITQGGELGGDPTMAKIHGAILVSMWFIYIIVSSNRYYGNIDDLWTISGSLAIPNLPGVDYCQ